MIEDDISEQIRSQVPAIEETKVLLGMMKKPQALHWLQRDYSVRNRWGPQLSESEKEDIIQDHEEEFNGIYEDAKSGLESPSPFRENNVNLRDPPDNPEVQNHIEKFIESDYFQEAFGHIAEGLWAIKLVPIDSLVAFQAHVATTAHSEIPTSDDGILDVFRYCLPTDVKNLVHVDDTKVPDLFSSVRVVSRNPNINFHGPIIQEIEDRPPGNITISFQVKARPNFVQVAHFQDRFILKNGYHRCYQLLENGEEYVPAVVRYAQNVEETGAGGHGWFPTDQIFGDRPPLVRDFSTDVAVELETKSKNKMIRAIVEKTDVEI